MSKGLGVRVVYRNDKLEPISEKAYSLRDYAGMQRADLQRLITDIEDLIYLINGNKAKEEWSDETWAGFCRIKHKLLDKAGDIGRLPENIFEFKDNGTSLAEFVLSVINEGC